MLQIKSLILIIALFFYTMTSSVLAQVPAFPGAEGFGSTTPAGRGGRVIEVTNLKDNGLGSFRNAIEASGPRIVVFRVGGTIELKDVLNITEPYITIAGQTAPGGGICIKNGSSTNTTLRVGTHDVVIRGLRVRPGPGGEPDGIYVPGDGRNIVIDHCSITWAVDEVCTISSGAHDVTVQWCIIAEGLWHSTHGKGPHSRGLMIGSNSSDTVTDISLHHNLVTNNRRRNPVIQGSGTGVVDYVNNVMYNWGQYCGDFWGNTQVNYVRNYGKYGLNVAAQGGNGYLFNNRNKAGDGTEYYVSGNIGPTRLSLDESEENVVLPEDRDNIVSTRYNAPNITYMSAFNAYDVVLANAGAIIPSRDAVDSRIVQNVIDSTGILINDPSEVGGWTHLATGTPSDDKDHDGMPDDWETANGLNPDSSNANGRDIDSDYDNIEVYINGLIPSPISGTSYKLNVDTIGCGSVDPKGGLFLQGNKVVLTATAGRGWIFDRWTGDLSGSQNPDTLFMDSDKNVTAVFVVDPYAVYDTLTIRTNGQGSVSCEPEPDLSGMRYLRGTQVTVTAYPDGGWEFDQWTGNYPGTKNPAVITIDSSITITAMFKPREGVPFAQDAGINGLVSMEAESFHFKVPKDNHLWTIIDVSPAKGASGDKAMHAQPNSGANLGTNIENSPRMDFDINFVQTGIHYVWVRGWCVSSDGDDNSVNVGLNRCLVSTADKLEFPNTSAWEWSKSTMDGEDAEINITAKGVKTMNIWMREDGVRLDKIVLTTNAEYTPSGTGPEEIFTQINEPPDNRAENFSLAQNFPNPFNPETTIQYQITRNEHVLLNIFNINGQKIKNLYCGYQSAGHHSIKWDGSNDYGLKVSAGIYIYQLKTDEKILSSKMLLLN